MASPRWLDDDEMKAWRAYITTSVDLMKALEHDVAPYGITMGDYQLLAMISEAPDRRLRMCDLADQLRLSRSGLTRRMDGVQLSGVGYGAVRGGELFGIVYQAPRLGFFPRYSKQIETMALSARLN